MNNLVDNKKTLRYSQELIYTKTLPSHICSAAISALRVPSAAQTDLVDLVGHSFHHLALIFLSLPEML